MVRGFEKILKGRDPRDAWAFCERACGVCTTVHALASVRTVENALGITVPPNAELVRNLMFCAQYMQDHVVHFYHLHALDWVDVVSALKADPAKTLEIARSISSWPKTSPKYFGDVRLRLAKFVESGQLGIFANGYWGHQAYKLPPEVNLLGVAHYLEALRLAEGRCQDPHDFRREEPTPQLSRRRNALRAEYRRGQRAERRAVVHVGMLLEQAQQFVEQVYIPDLLAVASYYKDWAAIGGGLPNYLVYGDLPANGYGDPSNFKFPRGAILNRDLSKVHEVDGRDPAAGAGVRSPRLWYEYSGGDKQALHPWQGETNLKYTGPRPPYEHLDVNGKYSWVKRLDGRITPWRSVRWPACWSPMRPAGAR